MKIVVLDGYYINPGDLSWEALEALGEFTCYDKTPDHLRVERIGDADAVLVNRTPMNRQTIRACPNLKCIALFATGYNWVDIAAARECGVDVLNIPDYSRMAVAQHALALLLEICNRISHYDSGVKAGVWSRDPDFAYRDGGLVELSGLTMGIVGYGSIGRALAAMALALGMEVVAARRDRSIPPEDSRVRYASLEELWAKADVVSLHVPLTPETAGMVNRNSISLMRKGVVVVNTSRGGLAVEEDVAEALASGRMGAYGTDVTATEPIPEGNPLLRARNCFITPHIAWAPLATRRRLIDMMRANLAAFAAGKPINVVN